MFQSNAAAPEQVQGLVQGGFEGCQLTLDEIVTECAVDFLQQKPILSCV